MGVLFLGIKCKNANCRGCFYEGDCYEYDTHVSLDVQSCMIIGGFDCSGNYAFTLRNLAVAYRLFSKTRFI